MKRVKCTLCGSEVFSILLTAEDYRLSTTDGKFNLVRCRRCGLVYLYPRPTKREVSKFYPQEYYDKQNRLERVVVKLLHDMKIKKITSFKRRGRILDVGCGSGELLSHLKERVWEVYGVDTSEVAYKLAKRKIGQRVFNCELKDCQFVDQYFDVITLNHVLEHMLDPNEELRNIHRILKDDGVLLLSTPNIDSLQFKISKEKWFGIDSPRHLNIYSPKTVKLILNKNGFRILEITYPLIDFPLDFYRSLKGKLTSVHHILVAIISPFLVAFSLLAKLWPAWRGSMSIVARKE